MKTLNCLCHSCGMKYEITFDDKDFVKPKYCAGCGLNDGSLKILEKVAGQHGAAVYDFLMCCQYKRV